MLCEGQSSDPLNLVKGKVPKGKVLEGQCSGRAKFGDSLVVYAYLGILKDRVQVVHSCFMNLKCPS